MATTIAKSVRAVFSAQYHIFPVLRGGMEGGGGVVSKHATTSRVDDHAALAHTSKIVFTCSHGWGLRAQISNKAPRSSVILAHMPPKPYDGACISIGIC